MAFCSMFYFFVISYFIISDIQCSERITAKTSTVTNSSKKKNIDLLQLINQETLIRFELDKNVHKINSKVETIKIDNKLASNRLNQEIMSINATLSGLRKNQAKTNEVVNIVKTNQTSTDSLLKEEIKFLKQKQKIDNKIANDRFNQGMLSINTTLLGLRKNQDETDEAVNIVKSNQTSTDSEIGLLKEEIKYFKKKQKINQKLARDQFNQEILSINTTLSGLRENQDETNEAVNTVKTDQTSTDSEIGLLKEEIKSMKQKHVQLEYNQHKLITDLVKDKIENTLLKKEIESLKANQKELVLNVTGILKARKSQISFTAGMSSYKDKLSYAETIIYDNVITKIGNAYNAAKGIFTAPQEGTYVFYFSTYPYNSGHHLYLDMVCNGITVVRGYTYDKDIRHTVSGLAVIHLTAGDKVWIRCSGGCNAGISYKSGSYTSTFSGFML